MSTFCPLQYEHTTAEIFWRINLLHVIQHVYYLFITLKKYGFIFLVIGLFFLKNENVEIIHSKIIFYVTLYEFKMHNFTLKIDF